MFFFSFNPDRLTSRAVRHCKFDSAIGSYFARNIPQATQLNKRKTERRYYSSPYFSIQTLKGVLFEFTAWLCEKSAVIGDKGGFFGLNRKSEIEIISKPNWDAALSRHNRW
jgi:hypothetical protein